MRKLNQFGFDHFFVAVLIVLVVGIFGAYKVVASHADSTSKNPYSCKSEPKIPTEQSTGTCVKYAQWTINTKGYSPKLVVDGIYGPKTKAGINWYKKKYNLVPDGIIGAGTWGHMKAETFNKATTPAPTPTKTAPKSTTPAKTTPPPAATTAPVEPTGLACSNSITNEGVVNGRTITWKASPTAKTYTVYVNGASKGSVAATTYTDANAAVASYSIVAVNAKGKSPNATILSKSCKTPSTVPVAVTGLSCTNNVAPVGGNIAGQTKLVSRTFKWKSAPYAVKYNVYRNNTLRAVTTADAFTDTVTTNATYGVVGLDHAGKLSLDNRVSILTTACKNVTVAATTGTNTTGGTDTGTGTTTGTTTTDNPDGSTTTTDDTGTVTIYSGSANTTAKSKIVSLGYKTHGQALICAKRTDTATYTVVACSSANRLVMPILGDDTGKALQRSQLTYHLNIVDKKDTFGSAKCGTAYVISGSGKKTTYDCAVVYADKGFFTSVKDSVTNRLNSIVHKATDGGKVTESEESTAISQLAEDKNHDKSYNYTVTITATKDPKQKIWAAETVKGSLTFSYSVKQQSDEVEKDRQNTIDAAKAKANTSTSSTSTSSTSSSTGSTSSGSTNGSTSGNSGYVKASYTDCKADHRLWTGSKTNGSCSYSQCEFLGWTYVHEPTGVQDKCVQPKAGGNKDPKTTNPNTDKTTTMKCPAGQFSTTEYNGSTLSTSCQYDDAKFASQYGYTCSTYNAQHDAHGNVTGYSGAYILQYKGETNTKSYGGDIVVGTKHHNSFTWSNVSVMNYSCVHVYTHPIDTTYVTYKKPVHN